MLIKRSVERAIAPRRSTNWTGGIKCSPANKNGWRENGKRKKPGALARAFHHSGRATCRNAYAAAGQTGCASRICVTRARALTTRASRLTRVILSRLLSLSSLKIPSSQLPPPRVRPFSFPRMGDCAGVNAGARKRATGCFPDNIPASDRDYNGRLYYHPVDPFPAALLAS